MKKDNSFSKKETKIKKVKTKKLKIKKELKSVEIPVFFSLLGWRINLNLKKIDSNSFIGIKKYSNYIILAIIVFSLFSLGFFLYKYNGVIAATYNFTQNSWIGGSDTENFPSHPDNQSNWTKYYEKDEGIEAGENIQLKMIEGEWKQKTETDFAEGDFNSTKVEVEGEDAKIILD